MGSNLFIFVKENRDFFTPDKDYSYQNMFNQKLF